MPQSLSKAIVHIIFSTKNREPWLDANVRTRMHDYLATICRDLGAEIVHVSGAADHIHIVTTLPRILSQAQLIEQIKKTSSKWIKTVDAQYRGFTWQRGYGAFSVSPSQLESARRYIDGHKSTIAPYIPRRVSRVVAQALRRFRRALRLGLSVAPMD